MALVFAALGERRLRRAWQRCWIAAWSWQDALAQVIWNDRPQDLTSAAVVPARRSRLAKRLLGVPEGSDVFLGDGPRVHRATLCFAGRRSACAG